MTQDLDYRIVTFDSDTQHNLTRFIRATFAREDDILLQVRASTLDHGLPAINLRPEEGHMLHLLARLIGARRILEIGTLAGYSGIWLARALPEDGQLITLEYDPHHAQIAREHFALAGLDSRVEVREGVALDTLAALDGGAPFDLVFLDADKPNNPAYLAWAIHHVRPGGLITAHNAFRGGGLLDETSNDATGATRAMLDTMATHDRLVSTIVPVGDGIAVALVQ